MRNSLRSQDKSIYLAFALSPSILYESFYDHEQSQDKQFHFQLLKGTQTIEKTNTFRTEAMKRSFEIYLYLSLPQYAQKLLQPYSIQLVQQAQQFSEVLYSFPIDLKHYIHEHNTQEKDFWTQILKHETQTFNLAIKRRVFLKRTRFELDDIINSQQMGQELDVVDIPHNDIKTSKIGIRKSKSYHPSLNSLISPKTLETISQEDTILMTERIERDWIGESKHIPQRNSASVQKGEKMGFDNQLKRHQTWVQKNDHQFNEEFLNGIAAKSQQGYNNRKIDGHNSKADHEHSKIKSHPSSETSHRGSKISKFTKDSQKQTDDNSISFLQKSSLLMDMSRSELNIAPDDQVCFKLKWLVLAIIILVLAAVASLSTDAFDITSAKRHKGKVHKKKGEKEKGKQTKAHKAHKERREVDA